MENLPLRMWKVEETTGAEEVTIKKKGEGNGTYKADERGTTISREKEKI